MKYSITIWVLLYSFNKSIIIDDFKVIKIIETDIIKMPNIIGNYTTVELNSNSPTSIKN